jgi:TetR/AcrR family transcriptional repressor of mexJK operon
MPNRAASPEPSPRRKPDAKRGVIIRGACRTFLAHGYGATSMNDVAAAAGVSKMTLYRYFRSKEELLAGVVGDLCERIFDADVAKAMEKLPLRDALATFGRRMLETVFAPETLGLHRIVIAESYRFPTLGKLFYDSGPGFALSTLASFLARHRKDPSLRVPNPARAAEEFMALLRGYAHMRALIGIEGAPSHAHLKRRVERAISHLLKPD